MEYITLVGESYEKALEEARRKYGDEVRVHSRKEYTVGGGVFRRRQKRCELTLYLAPRKAGKVEQAVTKEDLAEFEKEAQTPDPSTLSEEERMDTRRPAKELQARSEAERILDLNSISPPLRDHVLEDFQAGDDLALSLGDRIISSVRIDHESQAHPRKYQILVGPTGSGKTTSLAKIASLYQSVGRKRPTQSAAARVPSRTPSTCLSSSSATRMPSSWRRTASRTMTSSWSTRWASRRPMCP